MAKLHSASLLSVVLLVALTLGACAPAPAPPAKEV